MSLVRRSYKFQYVENVLVVGRVVMVLVNILGTDTIIELYM